MRLIGFTGRRGVGKSEAAAALADKDMVRAHAFGPGKAMCVAYFRYCGADEDTANRMVHGDLKDVPSPLLPGNRTPRYFMERLGAFMGQGLGPEWTLGVELAKVERERPGADVVVESVVYEEPVVRAAGGKIARITRPHHKGPEGEKTDEAEAKIVPDLTIVNDGSLEDLKRKVLLLSA